MLNRVILMGRLCADPEFRQTQSNIPVCRFRVAVDRPKDKNGNKEADFINCTAWRNTAEFVSRYFTKGKMIVIEGQLRNNDYTDNNGTKHYSLEVLCDNVQFGESKAAGAAQQDQEQPQYGAAPSYQEYQQQPYGVPQQPQYAAPPPPQYGAIPPQPGNLYHGR